MAVQYQISGRTSAGISESIEAGVRGGELAAGAQLPPVRELAGQLGVAAGTVAAAYQSLRQRGVIETAGRNGTRVRSRPPVAQNRRERRPPVPPGVLDLSTGEPDLRLLPDPWPHLRDLAADRLSAAGYRDAGVLPELAAVARTRLTDDGVPVPALTVTSGALDGIDRLLAAHLRPGDRVGIEDPGWANMIDMVAAQGLTPVPVPVDDDGPTPDGLRRALRLGIGALVVTARAQNPVGAAITAQRAAVLRDLLADAELLLIEDDHAAELAHPRLHPLAGATQRWAFLRSASKPFGPDLRFAVLAGDEATVARVNGRLWGSAGWVSTILQRLVLRLWSDAIGHPADRRGPGQLPGPPGRADRRAGRPRGTGPRPDRHQRVDTGRRRDAGSHPAARGRVRGRAGSAVPAQLRPRHPALHRPAGPRPARSAGPLDRPGAGRRACPGGVLGMSRPGCPVRSGTRRIHQTPDRIEIVACRPWLLAEFALLAPQVVVAPGATAGQALPGPSFRVTRMRGKLLPWPESAHHPEDFAQAGGQARVLATLHPSAVLRADDRESAYAGLVADLTVAAGALR